VGSSPKHEPSRRRSRVDAEAQLDPFPGQDLGRRRKVYSVFDFSTAFRMVLLGMKRLALGDRALAWSLKRDLTAARPRAAPVCAKGPEDGQGMGQSSRVRRPRAYVARVVHSRVGDRCSRRLGCPHNQPEVRAAAAGSQRYSSIINHSSVLVVHSASTSTLSHIRTLAGQRAPPASQPGGPFSWPLI